jgi:hypothetical protein
MELPKEEQIKLLRHKIGKLEKENQNLGNTLKE